MIDRILTAPVVIPALVLFALGISAYLNISGIQKDKERLTAVQRQFFLNDRNSDGFISPDEASEMYRAEFKRLNFDQDDVLSREEFVGLRKSWAKYHETERWKVNQAQRDAAFLVIDANEDKWVSVEEYTNYRLASFTRMDTDDDRRVSKLEYVAYLAAR